MEFAYGDKGSMSRAVDVAVSASRYRPVMPRRMLCQLNPMAFAGSSVVACVNAWSDPSQSQSKANLAIPRATWASATSAPARAPKARAGRANTALEHGLDVEQFSDATDIL